MNSNRIICRWNVAFLITYLFLLPLVAETLHLSSKEKSEELLIHVPEGWSSGSELQGADFITHSLIMTSPDGNQRVRLGWINSSEVTADPSALTDQFKTHLKEWLDAHKLAGVIKKDRQVEIDDQQAACVGLQLTEDGKAKNMDFLLVPGNEATYVLSVTYTGDSLDQDLTQDLRTVCVINPRDPSAKRLPLTSDTQAAEFGSPSWLIWLIAGTSICVALVLFIAIIFFLRRPASGGTRVSTKFTPRSAASRADSRGAA